MSHVTRPSSNHESWWLYHLSILACLHPPKYSSVYSNNDSTKELSGSQRGKSRSYVCQNKIYSESGGWENECTHKLLCTNVWARPCVKLLDDQVREMWFKFTQNPCSSAFKAWGLVGYTTAGTTVKEQSSKWLSLPWLTYIWPWQTNPNIDNRTYVKTICRRRKAGCGGRASLHLVTDTAVWRETSANMLIHKACRHCSVHYCVSVGVVSAFLCVHP